MSPAIRPVVLAGGNGVRLWPLSRASHPKPYLPLLDGGESPFQAAVRAAAAFGQPLVIGRDAHRFLAAEQLATLPATLVLEPEPRGGGAAVGLAACIAPDDAVLLIMPSECPGSLPAVAELDRVEDWRVGRDGEVAVWDLVSARRVRAVLAELLGEGAVGALRRAARTRRDLTFERVDADAWGGVPHLDLELLRRQAGAVDVAATCGPHLPDWRAVHRLAGADDHGNVLIGDARAVSARGCLVHAQERLVTVLDVEGLAVIETADAVLVAPLQAGDRVRDLVALLETEDRPEVDVPRRVLRPWGAFERIGRGARWLAKQIVVQPGEALSLQRHQHRAEHWIVVRGRARITRGDEVIDLGVDASTYIPCGVVHRLENPGVEPLVIVEVQTGDRLEEEDIERLEDRYGRRER